MIHYVRKLPGFMTRKVMSNHRSHNNNISTRVSTFHQPPTSDLCSCSHSIQWRFSNLFTSNVTAKKTTCQIANHLILLEKIMQIK